MRGYTVAAAAVSLGISPKSLDNVLIRNEVAGVSRSRQGVSRRLTSRAVLTLDIALRLARSSAMPLNRALDLVETALQGQTTRIDLEKGIALSLDLTLLASELDSRLAEAVEVAPVPRRGRPPTRA